MIEHSIDLSLPIAAPSLKGTRDNKVVIGYFPALLAEGKEFVKAYVRWDDGELLHFICNALVYNGDELFIGGRKIPRKKGEKFWIVSFSANEEIRLAHSEYPNVI